MFSWSTYLSGFVFFILEIMTGQILATPKFEKRREHFYGCYVGGLLINMIVATAMYGLTFVLTWNMYLNISIYTIMFASCLLTYWMAFKYPIMDVLLISTLSYILQHLSYKVYNFIFENIFIYQLYMTLENNLGTFCTCMSLLVFALGAFLFGFFYRSHYVKNFKYTMQNKKIIIYAFLTLIITIVLNSIYVNTNYGNLFYGVVALGFSILGLGLILAAISGTFELTNAKREIITLEGYYQEKLKQYENTKESIDLINIKCHDLKKEIEYLRTQKDPINDEDLKHIEEAIVIYDNSFKTGNDVLDSILTKTSLVSKSKNIELTGMFDGQALNQLKKEDIFALFSNILDNAIEAVSQLEEQEKRIISLSVKSEKGFIKIEESNYYQGDILFDKDKPVTSKGDKNYHGYGTKSIDYVVKKLNGKLRFFTDKKVFNVDIVIPLQEQKA